MHNLMADSLVRVVVRGGEADRVSLPELYALLAADRVASFPALRPHQAPAWHALLVQLAALACDAADRDEAPGEDADAWRELLRGLTLDWPQDEPWRLVSPPDQPAFLQPPSPGGELSAYRNRITSPDALDVLVTSKNHDVKAERMVAARADDWLFALVSLQTQEGFLGAGNYGVARMNGGFGSRSYLGLSPLEGGCGAAVMRDVTVLLRERAATLERLERDFGYRRRRAIGLLWLESWDGTSSLALTDLHPWFIEVCRRVRLETAEGVLAGRGTGSKTARIEAKAQLGVLGDPWAAVDKADPPKVLTLSSEGFTYRKMVELLVGSDRRTYELPLLAQPTREEQGRPMRLWAAALVRGQGKTEGFRTRHLDLPARVVRRLAADDGDDRLRKRAQSQMRMAADAAGKALRPALIILVQGGPAEPSWSKPSNDSLTRPHLEDFDARVDRVFFDRLWATLELDEAPARRSWAGVLADLARGVLAAAVERAPRSDLSRIMAHARARNLLEGSLHKQFPDLARVTDPEQEVEHDLVHA